MNAQQRKTLLKVAHDTIVAVVNGSSIPTPASNDPQLNAQSGCFVTIKNHSRLRGCIGRFVSDIPLIELISQMAVDSAMHDPRFVSERIRPDELDELDIEISVLSPLKKTTDPLSLRLGTDGIYIKKGYASGCFLPQVATETGWTKKEFLSCCCSHKAGLSPDAWQDEDTEVYLFTAEIFSKNLKDIG